MQRSEGIAGVAFTTGQPQLVLNAKEAPHFSRRFDALAAWNQERIALPLKARGRVLGVLELVNGLTPETSREHLQALRQSPIRGDRNR